MVDPDKTVQAFKDAFDKMSPTEQKMYLEKMGFSFDIVDNIGISKTKTIGRVQLPHNTINTRASIRYCGIRRKKSINRVNIRKKRIDS